MENRVLNQKLLKSLLISDFLVFEQNQTKNDLSYSSSKIFNSKRSTLTSLDPFDTILNLKQLVRLFSNLQKNKVKTKINFFLNDNNYLIGCLIKKFLLHPSISKHLSFEINTHKLPKKKEKFVTHFNNINCIIDFFSNPNFYKKQLKKKNRLFLLINSDLELEIDSYKIYNNFRDYKKILFFFSFLRQIILAIHSKDKYATKKKV